MRTPPPLLALGRAFESHFVAAYVEGDAPDVQMRTQVRVVKTRGSATWAVPTKTDKVRVRDDHPQKPLRPTVFTGFGYIDISICYDDNGLRSHVIGEVKNTNWIGASPLPLCLCSVGIGGSSGDISSQ